MTVGALCWGTLFINTYVIGVCWRLQPASVPMSRPGVQSTLEKLCVVTAGKEVLKTRSGKAMQQDARTGGPQPLECPVFLPEQVQEPTCSGAPPLA